jgi:hypothetical protein
MKITGRLIERIVIIADVEERDEVREYCINEGFNINHSGQRPIGIGKYSEDEIKVIAERELNKCPTKLIQKQKEQWTG